MLSHHFCAVLSLLSMVRISAYKTLLVKKERNKKINNKTHRHCTLIVASFVVISLSLHPSLSYPHCCILHCCTLVIASLIVIPLLFIPSCCLLLAPSFMSCCSPFSPHFHLMSSCLWQWFGVQSQWWSSVPPYCPALIATTL